MNSVSLPDFLALNNQLSALTSAGVDLDTASGSAANEPTPSLAEINAAITRRVAAGETVDQAIAAEPTLSPAYRCLVEIALRGNDPSLAFEGPHRIATSVARTWHSLKLAIYYPLILISIAYAGFVLLCLTLVPNLEEFYVTLQLPMDFTFRVLKRLHDTLPYWVAVPPLLVVAGWLLLKANFRARGSLSPTASLPTWIPGVARIAYLQECSRFAETLANLLRGDVPFATALPMATDVCTDASLNSDLRVLVATLPAPSDAPTITEFRDLPLAGLPPFLHWALLKSEPLLTREQALRLAADIYFNGAEHRSERLRLAVPVLSSLIIGGTVTFLYGLALFLPMTHLLWTVAS